MKKDLKPTFEKYYPENFKGGECAAFAERLVKFGPVGDLYASKIAYFKAHGSTVLTDIQVGDVVLTDDSKINGHVFIVNADMGNAWRVTESNFRSDKRVHHGRLVSKNSPRLKAHLRAPLLVPILNMKIQKNVLVVLSNVPDNLLGYVKMGIADYCARVAMRTAGEFTLAVDYLVSNAVIHTVHGLNTDGQDMVFADPADIGAIGAAAEQDNKKDYDSVCLIYDPTKVVGDPATRPSENPITINGINPYSIPTTWVMYPDGATDELTKYFPTKLFFGHENSHSDFYIINSEAGLGLRDKTHDQNPHTATTLTDDASDFFIDLLLELKPYWQYLSHETEQGEPMIIINNTSNPNAKFILSSDRKVGFADVGAFNKHIAGATIVNVTLSDVEFAKIPTSQAVIKS